ncbi:MAG: AbrB/MazE/SpoVT family DNA-binding domain-containing protein [Firmicutes bacterium]|nr:AbrB/MazE/SpoVT family DNA-binding domain-containing protein [Bacillota bacterium]
MERLEIDRLFAGSVTVGERGQVVIPAAVRNELGIGHGDRLLVFTHPRRVGVMLVKVDEMSAFLQVLQESLGRLQAQVAQEQPTSTEEG